MVAYPIILLVAGLLAIGVVLIIGRTARLQKEVAQLEGRYQRIVRQRSECLSEADKALADARKLPGRIKATQQYIKGELHKKARERATAATRATMEAQRAEAEAKNPSKAAPTVRGKTAASK